MKKIAAILSLLMVLCLLMSSCAGKAAERREDIIEDGKTVGVKLYEGDKLVGAEYYGDDGKTVRSEAYDGDGNLILEKFFSAEGALVSEKEYIYDGSELVRVRETMYRGDGTVKCISETDYSGDNITEKRDKKYSDDGETLLSDSSTSYTYTSEGVLEVISEGGEKSSDKMTNSATGAVIYTTTYTKDGSSRVFYDENGNRNRTESYDAAGVLTQYTDSVQDKDGHCIRSNTYDSSGKLLMYSLYTYDEGEKVKEISVYKSDDTLWRVIKYNAKGETVTYDANGKELFVG